MEINNEEQGVVKSDITLFSIIECLQRLDGAGVTEVADEIGIAKSAVHKHLKTLHGGGYVTKTGTEYRIGLRFLELGIYARNQIDLFRAASPKIKQLADESGELSSCVVEEAGMGVFLDRVTGENSVNTDVGIGDRLPLHWTAGGKVILAYLPEEEVRSIIDKHGLEARTEQTITDEQRLFTELEVISDRGYAINTGETIDGLHAIAAPIRDDFGTVLGTIGLAGAAYRLPADRCHDEISSLVLAAANEVELNLTYS